MPQAVTHILIVLIIASLIRDFYIKKKDKRKFPLHYVLITGLAGLISDIDIGLYLIFNWFNPSFNLAEHRIFFA